MASIIFMGTAEFSATVLERLIKEKHQILAVVSQPDRPVGRKRKLQATPVKQVALDNQIDVYQPERLTGSDELEVLLKYNVDFVITAAYGQYVPKKLLNHPKYYALNVHASLLPKYRGAAPIQYAIWQGESESGVSIMEMVAEMDAGGIFTQKAISIQKDDDSGRLFDKLAIVGSELLIETLSLIIDENIQPQPQNEALVTWAPMLKREDEQLDWSQDANQIDHHIRAFRPNPTTYTWMNEQRIKVWAGHPIEWSQTKKGQIGEILSIQPNYIVVQAGADTCFAITEWQESGKRRMLIEQAFNGLELNDWIGQVFYRK